MEFIDAYNATRLLESAENFAVSDKITPKEENSRVENDLINDQRSFWQNVINNPDNFWGRRFSIRNCVFSEWVARLPGAYYLPNAYNFRRRAEKYIISNPYINSKNWVLFSPRGKGLEIGGGGLGTLKLLPSNTYDTIATICIPDNGDDSVSTGIPILLTDEVKEHHRLKEGDVIEIRNAKWRPMIDEWSQKFPSVRGIPRGYLVIDKPELVVRLNAKFDLYIEPCSIVEHVKGSGTFYDYVFMETKIQQENYQKDIEDFFEYYRKEIVNSGEYLLPIDSNKYIKPRYISPTDLEAKDFLGKTQLEILEARIEETYFKNSDIIDKLLEKLPEIFNDAKDMAMIADTQLKMPPALITPTSASKTAPQIINYCIENDKMKTLIDYLGTNYPHFFNQ